MRDKIYQQMCCLRHQILLARSHSLRTYVPGASDSRRFSWSNVWPAEVGPRFIEPKDRYRNLRNRI